MKNQKKLMIRNSTAEFLIFTKQAGEDGIEVMVIDDNVWLTQKMMAILYDVEIPTINYHIKQIYDTKEQEENRTIRKFRIVQKEGIREIEREQSFYNLNLIIAIGFRVNSERAKEFRKWAANVLKDFSIKGYVLDKERLKNGAFFSEDYFEELLEDIREIRLSERKFYQKITDIYSTAFDYDKDSKTTELFYKTVQNKLHWAIHGHTAAELIIERADSDKENMGLTSWKNSPDGKIRKSDVSIAKNYLDRDELENLERIVTAYLEVAELQAKRRIPMSMKDWVERLNIFLNMTQFDILKDAGKVTAEIAKGFAEVEFEKFRIKQDKLFENDFDKLLIDISSNKAK